MKSQLKRKRRTLRENVERNAMNWLMRTGEEVDALQHDVYPENFYPVPDDTTEDSYMFEFDIDSVEDGENVVREGHDMSKKFVKILKAAGYEAYTIYRPSRDGETFVGLKVNNPTQKSLSESKKKSDIEMLAESTNRFLTEGENFMAQADGTLLFRSQMILNNLMKKYGDTEGSIEDENDVEELEDVVSMISEIIARNSEDY